MSRTLVVAGNWKMHMGPAEGARFLDDVVLPVGNTRVEVVLFPPALTLGSLQSRIADDSSEFRLGAQNVHWEDAGAYTGETSISMVREAGASHVLIGHSERRHVFGETDAEVGLKVAAVLQYGLVPVICVGEQLAERRAGHWRDIILAQVDAVVEPLLAAGPAARFLFAYEPVWAIGTGETATPDDASAAHSAIRGRLAELMGRDGTAFQVLYGGSVKPANAHALLSEPELDGVLVGGASLDPIAFAHIVAAATRVAAGPE